MIDLKALIEMLSNKEYHAIKNILKKENPADIATLIEEAPKEKMVLIFRMLPKDSAVIVFSNLFSETQQYIVESLSDKEIGNIIEELYFDDAVDFIEEMPANIVNKVLSNAKKDTRSTINQLLKYPENSAGSIMTVEYIDLDAKMTVKEALKRIRKIGKDKETIYTSYVTNDSRKLLGIISAQTLLLSKLSDKIKDVMDDNIIAAYTLDDRESVSHQFTKYDLMSIPVVDLENRLVGMITVDDIVDVVHEEATEDFEKMAAMLPSEKPYLKTNILTLAKNRILWLLILMVSAMITGGILASFEKAIATIPLLVTFIPMLTDTGGNAGSQSSTMVIRGMALHEIDIRDFFKVMWKELGTSFLIGIVLSIVNFVRVCIQYPEQKMIAATVAISLMITIVIAQILGGILPMIAKKCKVDPAVMAAPLITTIVDALSLFLFFGLAELLLKL